MNQKYEGILGWFLGMLSDGKTGPILGEWITKAHLRAVNNTCNCPFCSAMHRVTHLFLEMKSDELHHGDPWIKAAVMQQIEHFITSMLPPTPDTVMAVLACQVETARIISENNLTFPDAEIKAPGPPKTRILQLRNVGELLSVFTKLGVDLGINEQIKTLPEFAGETSEDNSADASNKIETAKDGDDPPDAEDRNQTTETMMPTTTEPTDNKITAHLAGTAFIKDGVRIDPPPGVTYNDMIVQLQRQSKEEEQVVAIDERVPAFPAEGAIAFQTALKREFGWVEKGDSGPEIPGFLAMLFGAPPAEPVTMLTIQTGLTTSEQVVWDKIRMPGVDGWLKPGVAYDNGRFFFTITGEVKKKHQARALQVITTTRQVAEASSIYRGKALELDLPPVSPGVDIMRHAPIFMKGLDAITPAGMIFTRKIEEELDTYIFGIFRRTRLLERLGVSAHRGALFMGPPGTGKTMAAGVTAQIATAHGWTFFYVRNPNEIVPMYKLAAEYGPAVLFVEDIDQAVLKDGEDDEVSEVVRARFRALLNVLDGIDTKGSRVFVIFTTNKDPRTFDTAFTREARLDSIINFTPPDAETAGRLIEWYLGDQLDPNTDLTEVAAQLAGLRPATIKEVCAKSILGAVTRLPFDLDLDNLPKGMINKQDLLLATRVAKEQLELAKPLETEEVPSSDEERAAEFLGKRIERAVERGLTAIATAVTTNHVKTGTNGATNGHGHPHHGEADAHPATSPATGA